MAFLLAPGGEFARKGQTGYFVIALAAALISLALGACGGGGALGPTYPSIVITSGLPPGGHIGAGYGGSYQASPCIPTSQWRLRDCPWTGFTLLAKGGNGTYFWSWSPAIGASLPPGLSVSNQHVTQFCEPTQGRQLCSPEYAVPATIDGTPTVRGEYNVIVTVSDSESPARQASAAYTITIAPNLGPSAVSR